MFFIAQFLLEKEANPNIKNKWGASPLHTITTKHFINKNQISIAELLIQKGAEIELKNSSWFTPIQLATQRGQTKIVELLIQYGADINVITPIKENSFYSGKSLIELVPKDKPELKAFLKLTTACKNNDFGIIDDSVSAKDIKGFLEWQISITPENSRFFSKHLSELYNLQNYLVNNPKLIDVESMQNLNKTINSYSTLKSSLIFKIVETPELHDKICDKNFTPHSNIPTDLIDQFKSCGLKLTGEIIEDTAKTT